MAKLTTSRMYYKAIKAEILDKIDKEDTSFDYLFLYNIISDFICFRIFAEFDSNINIVIKSFLKSHNISPKEKELGRLKPNEIKKYLKQKFKIPNSKLSFLNNREDFTLFIINRHTISHTAASGSMKFDDVLKYLDEADDIIDNINDVLIKYGQITCLRKSKTFFQRIVGKLLKI